MMVRAKFRVASLETRASFSDGHHETTHLKMHPVSDADNKTWSRFTPSGNLEISINNQEALNYFKLGKCYFLDFVEAPSAENDEK